MKLKAIRSDLVQAVGRVRKVVSEKTTMPILAHAVLRADAEANRLLIEGTNLVTGVSGVMVAHVETTGALAVSADAFYRVLQAAVTDVVEIEESKANCVVRAGRSRWKLPIMPASDHPGMPEAKEAPIIVLDGEVLRKSLASSSYAVSKVDGNEALKGVLFQCDKGVMKTVSTDGRRLGAVFTEIGNVPDFSHVVSASSVEAILRFLDESDGPVAFKESSPYLYFSRVLSPAKEGGGDGVETMVIVKPIQNKFPPYHRIIPAQESVKYVLRVNRNSFIQVIRRVMAAVKEKGATVGIELYPGKIALFHRAVLFGSGRDEMDVDVLQSPEDFSASEEPFVVEVNCEYLLNVLSILPNEQAAVSFIGRRQAVMIHGISEGEIVRSQLHLIMPIFPH